MRHLNPRCTVKIDGKTIPAPPIKFEVIEPPADAILVSHMAPLEGTEATKPVLNQCKPLIQQVQVGKRTLLIYRQCYDPKSGGGIYLTARLAELSGKCEMTVTGAYGDGRPLTITYKDAKSPTGTTKLVINSIDGTPWTAEDETALQERLKKAAPAKP